MAITKNKQSLNRICAMARAAFPQKGDPVAEELTEGLCNAAYKFTFADGFQTVLKIAPTNRSGLMRYESCLMKTEVEAMRQVAAHTDIKVAKIYRYDTSGQLCDGDYFFMEYLEGESRSSLYEKLSESESETICFETGIIQKKLSEVKGDTFGWLGDEENRFDSLFDFVFFFIDSVLADAQEKDVAIGVDRDEMLQKLVADRSIFDEVTSPSLVHWDMWDGNIFVKDGHISGIIDWERALWGEPLMDDRFRRHSRNDAFLRGFGIKELSPAMLRRSNWYDALLYLILMTEGAYRGYEDDGQYKWARPMFDKTWEALT